jgi:hypothetical protein
MNLQREEQKATTSARPDKCGVCGKSRKENDDEDEDD